MTTESQDQGTVPESLIELELHHSGTRYEVHVTDLDVGRYRPFKRRLELNLDYWIYPQPTEDLTDHVKAAVEKLIKERVGTDD